MTKIINGSITHSIFLIYSQKWIKEDVRWHDNGTMSYRTRKLFHFQANLSVGSHSTDLITTLNVPVISAYYQMRNKGWFETMVANSLISGM